MAQIASTLGFPPGLLGAKPQRVEILGVGADWVALNKPAGFGTRAHPWDAGRPDLDHALNQQIGRGVRELRELGVRKLGSVFYLDPVVSGVALFGREEAGVRAWRNCYGSGLIEFHFYLVTAGQPEMGDSDAIVCDKPLVADDKNCRMHISPHRGKRTETWFRRLGRSGCWSLWEAKTHFLRPHQVRIHAAAMGLPVVGDRFYGSDVEPKYAEIVRGAFPQEQGSKPFFKTLPLHLASIKVPGLQENSQNLLIEAPLPKDLRNFIRKGEIALS